MRRSHLDSVILGFAAGDRRYEDPLLTIGRCHVPGRSLDFPDRPRPDKHSIEIAIIIAPNDITLRMMEVDLTLDCETEPLY